MIVHPPWRARYTLEPEQARALIREQFPQLLQSDDASFERLGSGWDNDVWLVEGRYSFRFPRRHLALALLEHERLVLPKLLPGLSLPGPLPRFFGAPSARFPHLFTGYDYLQGVTCCRANPDEQTRAGHASALGRFLGELHGARLELEVAAPLDTFGRADVVKREAWYGEQLGVLTGQGLMAQAQAEAIKARVERLVWWLGKTSSPALCWVHGDLYVRHLLIDAQGGLSGVIDWGDVHLGDPALDLSIAFTYLPAWAQASFIEAYPHPIDAPLWARAQFLSLRSGLALLAYGQDIQDADLVREARRINAQFIEGDLC